MLVYRFSLCAVVLLLGGCHRQPDTAVILDDVEILRIAQLGHGPNARFVRCSVMTCPTVTLKHLADAQAASRWALVTFASGSAVLDESARDVLDQLAADLSNAHQLHLQGYTDNLGSDAFNLKLSQQRAQAVREYLLERAANPDLQVHLKGRGACCFIAPNHTPEGRAQNRRVEIRIDNGSPR